MIAVFLGLWLLLNIYILRQMFKKESNIKAEFKQIVEQHSVVEEVLKRK